jgi:uncharacterized protein
VTRLTTGLEIIGAESLGVRSLCCLVTLPDQRIVIDPGVSQGYRRNGLLPHPYQVAVGRRVRGRIVEALGNATDVVFSHFHGDHVPLVAANPYQLAIPSLQASRNRCSVLSPLQWRGAACSTLRAFRRVSNIRRG